MAIIGSANDSPLLRDEDVQVLHDFHSKDAAEAWRESPLFWCDVVDARASLRDAPPDVRVYTAA
jgi:hypothetical protein